MKTFLARLQADTKDDLSLLQSKTLEAVHDCITLPVFKEIRTIVKSFGLKLNKNSVCTLEDSSLSNTFICNLFYYFDLPKNINMEDLQNRVQKVIKLDTHKNNEWSASKTYYDFHVLIAYFSEPFIRLEIHTDFKVTGLSKEFKAHLQLGKLAALGTKEMFKNF